MVRETAAEVILVPHYDESVEPERRFTVDTPSGEICLYVDNPPAMAYLEPGGFFRVEFTRMEKK
jgi:hypothetical protein